MATITRFDPFREMLTFRRAMDRLFDDSVVSVADAMQTKPVEADGGAWDAGAWA